MGRLSISVADETEEFARKEANRRGIYLSGLIEQIILEHQRKLRNEAMIEGLLEDAEFDQAMANNEWGKVAEMEAADEKRRKEQIPVIVGAVTVATKVKRQYRKRK